MKHLTAVLALMTAALFLTGCGGDPHEAAVKDALDIMTDFNQALSEVTDVDSAKAFGDKAEALSKRFEELGKKMKEIEEPSEEKAKEIEEKYKPEIEKLQEDLMAQMLRISKLKPEVAVEMSKSMEKMKRNSEMPDWMK